MVVLNKRAFKLPRVEKDKFILLLRLGLDYDRSQGTFSVKNYNNIEKLTDTIASILDAGEVTFAQTCAICDTSFACSECKYIEVCATKNLPFQCVCSQCLREGKTFKETG